MRFQVPRVYLFRHISYKNQTVVIFKHLVYLYLLVIITFSKYTQIIQSLKYLLENNISQILAYIEFSNYLVQFSLKTILLFIKVIFKPVIKFSQSSRTKVNSYLFSSNYNRQGPNCLTTFQTQLTYHFNRRTAGPLIDYSPSGCDEPTSRCQTGLLIRTLKTHKPVIPSVPFIR
ncbi:hypothetical protein ABPG72_001067 [Tetrahymena utriculariae]